MSVNILKTLPEREELLIWYRKNKTNTIYEVNCHLHTPYSFSAFQNMSQIFGMAQKENVKILGINDFYVTDGFQAFYEYSLKSKIFPLFNIEFIGLLKEEQEKNIRVNDPNNPGRTYFCGKGLNYPLQLESESNYIMQNLKFETQVQVKKMIEKAHALLQALDPDLSLEYSEIKRVFAKELVRERHIARAIRVAVFTKYQSPEERNEFLYRLYDGKESSVNLSDDAGIENEIRANLLKAGGKAFVPEKESAFLPIPDIIALILQAGGIPCYPVLLDNKQGECTEYETDKQILMNKLLSLGVYCIELIPGRNDFENLKKFVSFFRKNGFIITFGTEHNIPQMVPLKVSARENHPLDKELKTISYEGACVIAAHQYLHPKEEEGYLVHYGQAKVDQTENFIELGKAVIEKYINL